jgi:pimeloyl-ACP methyl ester carboxylesterase
MHRCLPELHVRLRRALPAPLFYALLETHGSFTRRIGVSRMNIVLLHGSWHGAWCWHKVVPWLQSEGHRMHVPDLPAHGRHWRIARGRTTLASMAAHVCHILDSLDEPAFLVAHSRGGIVASTVAEMRPRKLYGIAYLAAYMLRDGERVADFFHRDKDSLVPPNIRISKATLTDSLAEEAYRPALYADCADADVELARSLLTAEPSLPALTRLRLSEESYGSVRRHYIELTKDKAVSLSLQRRMIAASPCASVSSIEASHSAYFSRPEQLAAVVHSMASNP